MRSVTLSRNALFNLLSFVASTVVNLLLVPLMIVHLGIAGFGMWAIIRAFIGYASVADLGLTSTVMKVVAGYAVQKDEENIGSSMKTAMAVYAIIFFGILLVIWIAHDLLTDVFFSGDAANGQDPALVLLAALAVFATSITFSVYQSALAAVQRMDLTNGVLTVAALLNGALMYTALIMGYGLLGLVGANAISTVFTLGCMRWLFSREFGRGVVARGNISLDHARSLVGYGKNIFIGALATNIHLHFDKLLLSAYLGMTAVTSYEIGARLVQHVRQIPVLMLQPLLPATSDLQAREDMATVERLYLRSLKYVIAGTVALTGILGMVGDSFIQVWLGYEDATAAATLRILLAANALNLFTAPGYYISIGLGNARLPMQTAVVGLTLNVVLSYVLLRMFGYFGAVAGSFLSLVVASTLFLVLFHRFSGIGFGHVIRLSAVPTMAIGASIGAWLLLRSFIDVPAILLLASLAMTSAVYGGVLYLFAYFDDEDKEYARKLLIAARILRPTNDKHA